MTGHSSPLLERFKYPVFLVLAAALFGGMAVLLLRRPKPVTITVLPPEPTPVPSSTPVPSLTPTPGPYMVDVKGAVVNPGVVTLDYGSRVLHAIDAAGGALGEADLERVNLAQILEDGDAVPVPTRKPGEVKPTVEVRIVTPTPGTIVIYVAGEVVQPDVFNLPVGSRVEHAIMAAGGPTDNADLLGVNLGQVLDDGDMVYVPPLSGEAIQTPTPNRAPLVHVNSASLEELDTLPGIGPAIGQAIIDYRTENGPFASVDELDNVPGIGPAKLEAIRDLVVID